jgi:hypothetical protein
MAADGRPQLCQNLQAVKLANAAGADVTKSVCETKGQRCPFWTGCRWIAQRDAAIAADVVFAAHNFVFDPLFKKIAANAAAVIIDEDFTQDGTGIIELPISEFSDRALREFPVLHDDDEEKARVDAEATAELHEHFVSVEYIVDQVEQKMPLPAALAREGLTKAGRHRLKEGLMNPAIPLEKA